MNSNTPATQDQAPNFDTIIGGSVQLGLDTTGSPTYLPGARTVGISGHWVLICNAALCVYSILLAIFVSLFWRSIDSVYRSYISGTKQRRLMTLLCLGQVSLGVATMIWIVAAFFRLSKTRVVDGWVVILGQQFSLILISVMLLLKAYYVCNHNRAVLALGTLLLLAHVALVGVKCSTIPEPTMRWGYYAVEIAAYLSTGLLLIINLVLNVYLSFCFAFVIWRHTRSAMSELYTTLIREGTIFALACTLTNIIVAILYLSNAVGDNVTSLVYHASWTLQAFLMTGQIVNASHRQKTNTTITSDQMQKTPNRSHF